MPLTQPWLYNEIRFTPRVEGFVACKRLIEPDRFPWPHLEVLPGARRLDRFRGGDPVERRRSRALTRLARRSGARVMHSHFGNIGWENLEAARRTALPHFVSFYGQDLTRFPRIDPAWNDRYREALPEAAGVLCEGPHMAKVVRALQPHAKIIVQTLGIELGKVVAKPRRQRRGEPLRVLIAGSFREKKGIPDALAALARLKIDVRATLIGDASADAEGQAEKLRIEAELARPELRGRVRRLGFVSHDELLREAYAHHVFLSPNVTAADGDTEGGAPLVLIEMAATGMPVVATTHCDIPNVLAPTAKRFLVPERDPAGLAQRLTLLAENPDEWPALAKANRRHIEQHHDCHRQGERLARIYEGAAR